MKRILILMLAAVCADGIASDTIRVGEYAASALLPVGRPVIIDSTDVERKKFEDKDLLKTHVDFRTALSDSHLVYADSRGRITPETPVADPALPFRDCAVQALAFAIDADRWCRATLSVTATEMIEIYVDGKREKAKDTREDSLSQAKPLKVELTLEPRRYDVVIKRLADGRPSAEAIIRTEILTAEKDSLARISISTDGKRRICINDIIEGTRLSGNSSLSPSGRYFLVGHSTALPGGRNTSSLELRETSTNRTVFAFPQGVSPRWTHDRDRLTFTRQGEEGRDLYAIDLPSLEEKLVVRNIPDGGMRTSNDGRFMFYTRREEIPADKGDVRRVLAPSDRSGAYRGRSSVWLYDFDSETGQRITFGHTSMSVSDISPDSRHALLMKHEDDITSRPFVRNTLYELDLRTLEMDSLLADPFIGSAQYSPDGSQLLITGGGEAFGGVGLNITEGQISNTYDTQAFIVDRKSGAVRAITKDFDPSVNGAQWSDFDGLIYFSVGDRDREQVYAYDPKTDKFRRLPLCEDIIRGFNLARQAPVAIYQGEGPCNAYRLYRYDLKSGKSVLLSDPFADRLSELSLSPVADWSFTSTGGTVIDGRYYLPYGFDPARKYPMIVYYYGGTSPTERTFESNYPLQVYAALGYVIYVVQPSGATGYGQEFSARHVNAWGQQTADDIITGTQLFWREHSFVDSTRVGCIGASYGGFMTQYLQTRTQIFAAAISHAGISDITSYWGEGYWGYSYSSAASAFSYPWNNAKMFTEQSPLFHADRINTPLLLLHGTADTNVPPGESIQMFNALRILGKTVELVTIDGENHHILATEKRLAWNKTIYAWFARWLKNEPEWWESLYPARD